MQLRETRVCYLAFRTYHLLSTMPTPHPHDIITSFPKTTNPIPAMRESCSLYISFQHLFSTVGYCLIRHNYTQPICRPLPNRQNQHQKSTKILRKPSIHTLNKRRNNKLHHMNWLHWRFVLTRSRHSEIQLERTTLVPLPEASTHNQFTNTTHISSFSQGDSYHPSKKGTCNLQST